MSDTIAFKPSLYEYMLHLYHKKKTFPKLINFLFPTKYFFCSGNMVIKS